MNLISEERRKSSCTVINVSGDADVHIAKAAVNSSEKALTYWCYSCITRMKIAGN